MADSTSWYESWNTIKVSEMRQGRLSGDQGFDYIKKKVMISYYGNFLFAQDGEKWVQEANISEH